MIEGRDLEDLDRGERQAFRERAQVARRQVAERVLDPVQVLDQQFAAWFEPAAQSLDLGPGGRIDRAAARVRARRGAGVATTGGFGAHRAIIAAFRARGERRGISAVARRAA
jgi:hypothetical protein